MFLTQHPKQSSCTLVVRDVKKLIAAYEAIDFQSLIADVLYRALFLFVPVIKHSWVVACDAHKTKHLDFFQKPDDFLVIKQRIISRRQRTVCTGRLLLSICVECTELVTCDRGKHSFVLGYEHEST